LGETYLKEKVNSGIMLRPLTRKDLPKKTGTGSLHIPVVYKNKLRFVCDISYGSDQLCWLENNDGIPVLIKECELITNFKEYLKVVKIFTDPGEDWISYGKRMEDAAIAVFSHSSLVAPHILKKTI
jgi:hypothetical protein